MKNLLLLGLMLLSPQAWSQPTPPEVVRVISEQTRDIEVEVTERTFVPNIQGYACAWPAIDIPLWQVDWHVKLKHSIGGGFMVEGLGLAIRNLDMQFCSWPTPKEVFGMDLIVGEKIKLHLKIVRDIVNVHSWDGKTKTLTLRETISSKLGTQEIYSEALVALEQRN